MFIKITLNMLIKYILIIFVEKNRKIISKINTKQPYNFGGSMQPSILRE